MPTLRRQRNGSRSRAGPCSEVPPGGSAPRLVDLVANLAEAFFDLALILRLGEFALGDLNALHDKGGLQKTSDATHNSSSLAGLRSKSTQAALSRDKLDLWRNRFSRGRFR